MPNITEQLANELIKHGVNLARLEAGTRRKVIGVLNGLGKEFEDKLRRIDPTGPERMVYRDRRRQVYIRTVAESMDKAFREIERILGVDLKKTASMEAGLIANKMNASIQVELVSGALTPELLSSIVSGTALFGGERLHDWYLAEKNIVKRALNSVIREGVLLGTPVQDMVRKINGTRAAGYHDGFMRGARARSTTIVRTAVNAITNETRDQVYNNNSDVIKGKQWLSTLDTRTSDTCIALDGQAWDLEGKKLEGTTIDWRGPPPAHPNCRSTLVPVLKSWSELNRNPAIRQRLKAAEQRIKPTTRANMDGKPVSTKMTYEKWLGEQSKTRQLEVLGPTKYKLWKQDKLSLTDLIDQSHRPLTIDELIKKYDKPQHRFISGSDWYKIYAEKNLKKEAILEKFDPSIYAKITAIQKRIDGTVPTDQKYFINGAWDKTRALTVHAKIIEKFINEKTIKAATPIAGAKPKYIMFGGRGGSGKGSFTRSKAQGGLNVIDKNKYIVLDADEIKQLLPEYEGWNAFQLHEESSYLFDKISDIARKKGLNIVHDMTLKTGKTAINRALQFKKSGYSIDGYYMFLSPQEAAKRAVKRFLGPTQRYVPPEVVLGNTANEANFDALMKYFEKWEFYDNQGTSPVLIAKG